MFGAPLGNMVIINSHLNKSGEHVASIRTWKTGGTEQYPVDALHMEAYFRRSMYGAPLLD